MLLGTKLLKNIQIECWLSKKSAFEIRFNKKPYEALIHGLSFKSFTIAKKLVVSRMANEVAEEDYVLDAVNFMLRLN